MVLSWYLCILARVLLSSHEVFSFTINQLAVNHKDSEHHILSKILDVWLLKMCNVSQIEQRKLLGRFCHYIFFTASNNFLYLKGWL